MEMTRIVTLFASRDKPDEPENIFHITALERIRDGASKSLIAKIRALADKKERNKLKALLPCICFSGRFMKRKNEAIVQHSGYICLDFDDCANPEQLKADLFAHLFVKAVWISPSGTGVKCLVRVPNVITQHRGHFAALEKLFPGIDESGKDEARICYESYDPLIMIRDEPDVFEGYEVPDAAPPRPQGAPTATRTDYSKINSAVATLRKAQPGSRNETLLKASRLAGGYVASGYIPEAIAYQILEDEARNVFDASEIAEELHTIKNGIEYGKQVPIYDQEPEEKPVAKTVATHSIKFLAGCWDKMKDQHKNGKVRGTSTHMYGMDGHFSWKKKEITGGSGYPNSGKSEFFKQMCLLKSVFDGTKWAWYGAEEGDAEEFYDGLIHTLIGKSTDPVYSNQMSLETYATAAEFIQDHFYFIDPDTEHTRAELEANFEYCIRELGVEGCVIDPINALAEESGDRDDKNLNKFYNKCIRFAKVHNIYYVIIMHPSGGRKVNPNTGEYDVMGIYDIAGGAMSGNKLHNFIVVHRPLQNTEPDNTVVDIHIKKIKKQRLVGIPGIVRYSFERGTNRYMWFNPSLSRSISPLEKVNGNITIKKGGRFK